MPASVALPAVFALCAYQHGSQVVLSHACYVLLHLWRVVALQIFLSFRQPTCPARAVPAAASLAECVLRQAVVWQRHGEVAVKCCPCGCRRMRVLLPSLITLRGRAYSTLPSTVSPYPCTPTAVFLLPAVAGAALCQSILHTALQVCGVSGFGFVGRIGGTQERHDFCW